MNDFYLAVDNETGGIPKETSLLSTFLQVLDSNFNVVDELELYVKPNDGLYVVKAEGLGVNKINIVEHDKIAITYSEAGQKLFKFLDKNSDHGKIKLIPLGKNVNFDIQGLQNHLLGESTFNRFVSYRVIDITTYARCLQIKGKIPAGMGLSLFSLADFLNVTGTIDGNPHEAKYDTLVANAVFKELLKL